MRFESRCKGPKTKVPVRWIYLARVLWGKLTGRGVRREERLHLLECFGIKQHLADKCLRYWLEDSRNPWRTTIVIGAHKTSSSLAWVRTCLLGSWSGKNRVIGKSTVRLRQSDYHLSTPAGKVTPLLMDLGAVFGNRQILTRNEELITPRIG
jgi:hypothetical protein